MWIIKQNWTDFLLLWILLRRTRKFTPPPKKKRKIILDNFKFYFKIFLIMRFRNEILFLIILRQMKKKSVFYIEICNFIFYVILPISFINFFHKVVILDKIKRSLRKNPIKVENYLFFF